MEIRHTMCLMKEKQKRLTENLLGVLVIDISRSVTLKLPMAVFKLLVAKLLVVEVVEFSSSVVT